MDQLNLSETEWRRRLTPEQYHVLREAGTERAFAGALTDTKADGLYRCAACGNLLFDSADKYDSGSGWPSFTRPADPHAITDLDGTTRLASIPGQVPLPGSWTSGCRFAPRCRFAKNECLVTVPLEPRSVGVGAVRCVRKDEVRGRQEEWRLPATTGGRR